MGFIDGTVVAIALPAIRNGLDATLPQAQWISNAYMLTLSALLLAGGAFGDRFGLARVFAAGIVIFVLSSILCAIAITPESLIAARAVQGIGAALMVPGSLALISRAYPREERGRAIGIWAAASALTTALGPIIGGLALTYGGDAMWRLIFALNLPLGIVALWLLYKNVQSDPSSLNKGIDISGALLATVGLGLLAYALTQAESRGLVSVAPYIAAGFVCVGLFIWVETRSPHPMMPLDLFRLPGFSAANISSFFLYFAMTAILFFLPMTVISGWGKSEIVASAAFAPIPIFMVMLSTYVGKLADRIGALYPIATGSLLTAIGYAIIAATFHEQNFWLRVLPAMALVGIGMSLVVAPLSAAIMGVVDNDQAGAASGVNNAISRIAGLMSVAAMGSVSAYAYGTYGGGLSFGIEADTPGHVEAMNRAFAVVAWICAGLAGLSCLTALVGLPRHMIKER
ncbi:MFS transporter [Sulfitobacter sp. 1151]|uniref:MFS transporter n=2 Tax=Parasulfitobacter algicola TaxID=2614809 RepID=A0ABX2ISJ1_9RHOB|nr:MFS transporter [Sulfitobacter algicola]